MGDARSSDQALLVGHAVSWFIACFFAVALVSGAVVALAQALGRPALASSIAFAATVEAVVHLALAALVFALARRLERPRWYWAVGPVGYLAAFGYFLVVMYVLGDTLSLPAGPEWAYVAADAAATALGAWLVLRGPRGARREGPSPEEPAT